MDKSSWYKHLTGKVELFFNYGNRSKKNTLKKIRKLWGMKPKDDYLDDDWDGISRYFKITTTGETQQFFIDTTTWNDLEMNEIFKLINNTLSSPGEECLFDILHKPSFHSAEIEEKKRLIKFFWDNQKTREKIQYFLHLIGKYREIDVVDYCFGKSNLLPSKLFALFRGLSFLPILLFVIFLLNSDMWVLLILSFVTNMVLYYWKKRTNSFHFAAFDKIAILIKCAGEISKLGNGELDPYLSILKKEHGQLLHLQRRRFETFDSGGLLESISAYLRIFFLRELIDYEIFVQLILGKQESLQKVYSTIGYLDAMISVASFQNYLQYWVSPELKNNSSKADLKMDFVDLVHPLLANPVGCTLDIIKSILVTGSNASGKSTFLKSVAINAILAQTIVTVCARKYSSSYFKVLTSMALKDNIQDGESYFVVEAKSMKRMIDQSEREIPCLCIVDEVLRGTNTIERIAASSELLRFLSKRNILCLAATHDYELSYLLEKEFKNYHFCEDVIEGEILFNYKIQDGYNKKFNAIKILAILKYPIEIIINSEKLALKFAKEGVTSGVPPLLLP